MVGSLCRRTRRRTGRRSRCLRGDAGSLCRALPLRRTARRVGLRRYVSLALPWRFDRVLIPYNSLYCLTTHSAHSPASKRSPITSSPAVVLLDAYAADPVAADEAAAEPWPSMWSRCSMTAIDRLRCASAASSGSAADQRDLRLSPHQWGWDVFTAELVHPAALRVPASNAALVDQAGLVLEAVYGDFEQAPFTDVRARWCWWRRMRSGYMGCRSGLVWLAVIGAAGCVHAVPVVDAREHFAQVHQRPSRRCSAKEAKEADRLVRRLSDLIEDRTQKPLPGSKRLASAMSAAAQSLRARARATKARTPSC